MTTTKQPLTAHDDYRIVLYYLYTEIRDAEKHVQFQTALCDRLDLTGRIRVATEGINGVLSGRKGQLQEYETTFVRELQTTNPSLRANDLDLKYCYLRNDLTVEEQLFPNLIVKITKTVIGLVDTPSSSSSSKNRRQKSTKHKRNRFVQVNDDDNNIDNNNHDNELSDTAFVRRVYERTMKDLALDKNDDVPSTHDEKESMRVPHLNPDDWDRRVETITRQPEHSVVFLDCRNMYESNVGHFRSPHAQTILTNTRKFSELPQVLVEQSDALAQSTHIFAYCTGGVRCERATVFLKGLLRQKYPHQALPEIYQLRGGIQRYLEHSVSNTKTTTTQESKSKASSSLYKGKNFVFDPRRMDPVHDASDSVVGRCLVCQQLHDDYDNGHAPVLDRAARCWNCRVLILVCNQCRSNVSCWGDDERKREQEGTRLPRMYCGGPDQTCWHRPPVQVLTESTSK